VSGNEITPGGASLSAGAQEVAILPAVPYVVYSLETTGAAANNSAVPVAALQCLSDSNASLLESGALATAHSTPPAPTVAIICPPGTSKLSVTLANKGSGQTLFGPVALYETEALR
jgi:hypothetical protein